MSLGNKKLNWWQILLVIGSFVAFFLFIAYIASSSPSGNNTQQVFRSPSNELLFEINLALTGMRQSKDLSRNDTEELGKIDLATQDTWNEELGYYVYLSPQKYQKLSDTQVIAVLTAIRSFRRNHSEKWFDVMIFDDPTTARSARTSLGKYEALPEKEWCENIFSHYRGIYSWNPTNQYEAMNLNMNCNWKSLIKS